jgi:cytochrome d ubiquinol oxidase subunit I
VTGLDAFDRADRPPVQATFQFFHLMVAIGMALIGISWLGILLWWRGWLFDTSRRFSRAYLWLLVFAVLLPQISNQSGWFTAEIGRQPWIVYGLLRTSDGLSEAVVAGQVLFSLTLFGLIYLLLFALFIFLLDRKIRQGPVVETAAETSAKRYVRSDRKEH